MSSGGPPSAGPPLPIDPKRRAESRLGAIMAPLTVVHFLAIAAVLMRFYTRIILTRTTGRDDWVMLASLVSSPQPKSLGSLTGALEGLRPWRLYHLRFDGDDGRHGSSFRHDDAGREVDVQSARFLDVHHSHDLLPCPAQDFHRAQPPASQYKSRIRLATLGSTW